MLTFKSGEHSWAWSLSFWVHMPSKLLGVSWIVFPVFPNDLRIIFLLLWNQFFITLGSRSKVDRYFVSSSVRYLVFSKCSWSFWRWYSSKRIFLPFNSDQTVTLSQNWLRKIIQKGSLGYLFTFYSWQTYVFSKHHGISSPRFCTPIWHFYTLYVVAKYEIGNCYCSGNVPCLAC